MTPNMWLGKSQLSRNIPFSMSCPFFSFLFPKAFAGVSLYSPFSQPLFTVMFIWGLLATWLRDWHIRQPCWLPLLLLLLLFYLTCWETCCLPFCNGWRFGCDDFSCCNIGTMWLIPWREWHRHTAVSYGSLLSLRNWEKFALETHHTGRSTSNGSKIVGASLRKLMYTRNGALFGGSGRWTRRFVWRIKSTILKLVQMLCLYARPPMLCLNAQCPPGYNSTKIYIISQDTEKIGCLPHVIKCGKSALVN